MPILGGATETVFRCAEGCEGELVVAEVVGLKKYTGYELCEDDRTLERDLVLLLGLGSSIAVSCTFYIKQWACHIKMIGWRRVKFASRHVLTALERYRGLQSIPLTTHERCR